MTDDQPAQEGAARGRIQALDAALIVLRAIRDSGGPATLTDLARAAGMPPSKVHRYLASFIHAGIVTQRTRSGRYDVGPFAAELGLAALARNDFVNRSADGLEELSAATGLTALLSVWGTQGATVIRWEKAASFVVTSLGLGSTLPLLNSASGRIFLAFTPRRLTAARAASELAQARAAGVTWPDLVPTRRGVDTLAADVRQAGWASVDGRFIPGLKALAMPVVNWQGEAELCVTLIGTQDRLADPDGRAWRHLREFTDARSIRQQAPALGR